MNIRISALILLLVSSMVCIAAPRDQYFLESGDSSISVASKGRYLLAWSLELATSGVALPTEIHPAIYKARSLNPEYESDLVRVKLDRVNLVLVNKVLDGFADELMLLQDTPENIGSSRLDYTSPTTVGRAVSLTQVFTVGTRMDRGSAILIGKQWQHDIHLQVMDEEGANYISLTTSNPDVRLQMRTISREGIHGSRFGLINLPLAVVRQGSLLPGDRVTIHYSDRFELPEFSTLDLSLPIYFQLQPGAHFYTVPVEKFKVQAGAVKRLTISAPSIVAVNEPFTLEVRGEDEFGNVATGSLPSLEVIVDGVFQQRIPRSSETYVSLDNLVIDNTGLHSIAVRSGGGGLTGSSNPVLVQRNPKVRVQWVNLHAHSTLSDGLKTSAALGRESRGLYDLLLVADHDSYRPHVNSDDIRELDEPLARGGHRIIIPYDPPLVIALPEITTDHRLAIKPTLVEIFTGASSYDWYGEYYAARGYRIGFYAGPTAHIPRRSLALPKTALIVADGETWQQAVAARRTFVSTGPKSLLLTRTNDAYPGSRIPLSERRLIEGEVYANAGISAIELLRNGIVIDQHQWRADEDSSISDDELKIKITLQSQSNPFSLGLDTPRNGRQWLGYVKVSGAEVTSVVAPGIAQQRGAAIQLNPDDSSRVDFIAWTHGNEKSFTLSLKALGDGFDKDGNISFEVVIQEGFEDVDLLSITRKPSITPMIRQLLSLGEFSDGPVTRGFSVNGYDDSVTYSLLDRIEPLTQTFRFVDTRRSGAGDYYYVRVKQSDDHLLYSSPVYVGGYDIR
jgi:hypothetical protein